MNRRLTSILLTLAMVITMTPILPVAAASMPFKDVSSSDWYYNDVKIAYDTGLINGMTATTFEPKSNLTYAQAIKLAACMYQKYNYGSVSLTNGSKNWWDSYVDYAKRHNIISKDYSWNSNATRAGYVEIFAKALPDVALKAKNSIADGAIPDVSSSHPQASSIYKLYRAGVLNGMDDEGTFEPNSNIRRSEVSAILTRMMNEDARKDLTLGSNEGITEEEYNTYIDYDKKFIEIGSSYSNEDGYVNENDVPRVLDDIEKYIKNEIGKGVIKSYERYEDNITVKFNCGIMLSGKLNEAPIGRLFAAT